jgi:DNA-binding SARP family transcriptional activator
VVVRCLGAFSIGDGSNVVDLGRLRPRARSVVHRLALDFGRPIHRDMLLSDLWSDTEEASAIRSLQVAISSIRRVLESAGSSVTIERADGGYLFNCANGKTSDLVEFSRIRDLIGDGRCSDETALDLASAALGLYRGDLLDAEGLAEWVVSPREQIRLAAAQIARTAGERALACGALTAAVSMTQRGLEIDRFDDDLWRLAIRAHERRGDDATATQLRRRYDAMLEELGVPS